MLAAGTRPGKRRGLLYRAERLNNPDPENLYLLRVLVQTKKQPSTHSLIAMEINRRDFIKKSTVAGLGASFFAPNLLTGKDDRKVRLGFIGVGLRGTDHLRRVLNRPDVQVTAICDINPTALTNAVSLVEKAGQKKPKAFGGGEEAFREMLQRKDMDGVIIATPWEWHVPMAVATMKAGKYAGVEVAAALTLDECWNLVNTSESTGQPCMLLENVCYRRDVMAVLHMVRQGLFGETIHGQCGYQHDLRHIKFEPGAEFGPGAKHEAVWRTAHSVKRNADIYPTHGIGPIANCFNIDRGNRFEYLTSIATKSRGLHNYIVAKGGENHPNAKVDFALGDVVTTMIKCANGETIVVSHDTNLPRPYSLMFRVQGTKGLWMDDNSSIYIEGLSPKEHTWEPAEKYLQQYDHPLWAKYSADASGTGHGGMDFFVTHAFIESIKNKVQPPIDVYDAASWSAITPLSEQSIANGSAPMPFPDFTRGKWKTNKPIFGLTAAF
jgi:hypothetical protein